MADELNFIPTDAQSIYNTIMADLMDHLSEALYPGDERRIFAEALASVIISMCNSYNDKAKQRMLQYARGTELDAIGARYDVQRAAPAHAYATFRFSVETTQPENIIIPAGTKVTTDGSVYFATEQVAVLQAGTLSVDAPGVCTSGGSEYNGFTVGSVATLVDLIPYVSATNTTSTTGGDDGEPYTIEGDEKYRERIRLSPSKQSVAGPVSAYEFFALSADPDIVSVAVDVPSANTVDLYPLMRGGEIPDHETLAKVEAACSGEDVRPMTDKVTAKAPEQVEYSISLKYYTTKDAEAATVQTIEADGGAVDQYIAWQCGALARDINPDQLRRFILAPDNGGIGAVRVDIISPTYQAIDKAQVAKLTGKPTITHEIVR